MRLIPIHNALLTLSRLLEADAAAIKLIPHAGALWQPTDVAVGETYELQRMGWHEGGEPPQLEGGVDKTVFGIPNVRFFDDQRGAIAWHVDVTDDLLNAMPGQFKFSEKRGIDRESLGSLWIGVILGENRASPQFDGGGANAVTELLLGVATQLLWGLYQSAQTLSDPMTGLRGAAEFRHRLQRVLLRSNDASKGVALLLIGIDDYAQRRRQFGQEHAERLVGLAAPLLEGAIRKQDDLYSYREAHFAVVAHVQNEQACERVAQKLMRAFNELTDLDEYGATSASIGYVFEDQSDAARDIDLQALCMSAEQALERAVSIGGNQIISFNGSFDSDEYNLTTSSGSMMGDPARERRNNQILWQTVSLIAAESEPENLCRQFTDLLDGSLDAHGVLLVRANADQIELMVDVPTPLDQLLDAEQQQFVQRGLQQSRTLIHTDPEAESYWLAAPMISRAKAYGCLFLDSKIALDAADQVFFKALADQIAGALDRAELARREILLSQEEAQALRAQITDLQQNLGRPKIAQVANSDAMRRVLDFVGRVAPTDVSILIMGESGAGKEIMARTIHESSSRKHAALVTVDCGAITHSLIDSELFGRVKGAFTGADQASTGRMAQAQGGTLFLDEIGELPLDVQSKLLRFVQEKEVVAVGGTHAEIIDTRIICATNRDLALEVAAGRFRADLYYRLQVIQVVVPPLRERADDMPQLVENLLANFAIQFNREIEGLSESAWDKVRGYHWAGNVRELQNTLLRAMMTAHGPVIHADDLQLNHEIGPLSGSDGEPALIPRAAIPAGEHSSSAPMAGTDAWSELGSMLRRQVQALRDEELVGAPIGRWLSDALVLAAFDHGGQVVCAGARIVGVPETTLRRQLARAQQNLNNPLHVTSSKWLASLPALTSRLRSIMHDDPGSGCLADSVEAALLKEVVQVVKNDHSCGAALMGVTPPTYKRRLRKHEISTGASLGTQVPQVSTRDRAVRR